MLLSVSIGAAVLILIFFHRQDKNPQKRFFRILPVIARCFLAAFFIEAFLLNTRHYELIGAPDKNVSIPLESVLYRWTPLPTRGEVMVSFTRQNDTNAVSFSTPVADVRNIKITTGKRSMENIAIGVTITPHELAGDEYLKSDHFFFPEYDPNPIFRYKAERPGEESLIYFGNAIYLSYLQITGIIVNAEIPLRINPLRIFICMFLLFAAVRSFKKIRGIIPRISIREAVPAALFLFGICVIALVSGGNMTILQSILSPILTLLFSGLLVALTKNAKQNEGFWMAFMLAAGFLLRFFFIWKDPWYLHQHDVITIDIEHGHIGYILYIFAHGTLPEAANWQFTHPPLHHALYAGFLKILTALRLAGDSPFDQLQYLSLLISMLILFVSRKLLSLLGIHGRARILSFSILCFHPYLIYLAGSLNNDQLLFLFTLCTITGVIQWDHHRATKMLALAGFSAALATVTKVSGLLITPAVFLLILLKALSEKQAVRIFLRNCLAFGLPLLPLPLWWAIRCTAVLGIPFNYVGDIGSNSGQYIGNYAMLQRIFTLDSGHLKSFFMDPYPEHYNLPVDLLKSSLFDEWVFPNHAAAGTLFFVNLVLILCAILAKAEVFKKDKNANHAHFLLLYGFQFLLLGSFLYFCYKYPQVCSQNFRYVIPSMWIGVVSIGAALMNNSGKKGKIRTGFQYLCAIAAAAFNLSSSVFFITNL